MRDATQPVGEVAPTPEQTLALVGSSNTDMRQHVRMIETWAEVTTVTSGPISGRVTAVSSLASIDSGAVVVEVDGRQRVAQASQKPLWREITSGLAGEDVTAVAELLDQLGFLDSSESVDLVDTKFMSAVRRFERAHGWDESGIFKPDYVVWIPWSPFDVGRAVPAVGGNLHPDSPLLIEADRLLAASFTPSNPNTRFVLPDGPLVFDIPGVLTVPLSPTGRVEASADLETLARYLLESTDNPNNTVPELSGSNQQFGIVRLATPRELQTVATNSLLVSASGRTCVVTEGGSVEPITVVGGFGGVTEIEVGLEPELRLLLDPSPDKYSC